MEMPTHQSITRTYSVAFLTICAFALVRPLVTTSFFATHSLFGLSFLEVFGIGMSYLFFVLILFNLNKIRLDGITFLIVFFCFYCLLSILWGSNVKEISKLILPVSIFFLVRVAVKEEWQVNILLVLTIIGYIIPIFGSALLISLGKSIYMTIYWTGTERYAGMYSKIHTLAHSMFVFMAVFLIYKGLDNRTKTDGKYFLYFCYFLTVLSLYNVYYTYTRTAFIGIMIFVILYLFGRRSYKIIITVLLLAIIIVISSSNFRTIFFDVYEGFGEEGDISKMGSGRVGIWTNIISTFSNASFEVKGIGFGVGRLINNIPFNLAEGHSDLISLLLTLGIIGVIIYLSIFTKMFLDVAKSKIRRIPKYTFLGFLFAVFCMNSISNSYLARFELAQYFFFIMGIFYVLHNNLSQRSYEEAPVS